MVKGVNKTVIEINDTGNELFEKIILYVAPKYGGINPVKLRSAALKEMEKFKDEEGYKKSLRALVSARRRRRKILTAIVAAFCAAAVALTVIVLI